MSGISLEAFKQLPPEEQATVLQTRRQRVQEIIQEYGREAGLTQDLESILVPQIQFKKSVDLPPIPNRDEQVRRLMLSDDSIEAVVTRDGVKYLR